jgi:hypothetical protein
VTDIRPMAASDAAAVADLTTQLGYVQVKLSHVFEKPLVKG